VHSPGGGKQAHTLETSKGKDSQIMCVPTHFTKYSILLRFMFWDWIYIGLWIDRSWQYSSDWKNFRLNETVGLKQRWHSHDY
jgi:hypothetical protein